MRLRRRKDRKVPPPEPVKLDPVALRELNEAWRRSMAVQTQLEMAEIEAQVIGGKVA